jgi:hypothetical protein
MLGVKRSFAYKTLIHNFCPTLPKRIIFKIWILNIKHATHVPGFKKYIYIEDFERVHMAYEIYEMSNRIWYFPSLGEGNIQIQ